ncbi:peptidoglycan binding domain-containing protein [Clostridium sp.]|uniref:peptidoglycan binding domain-containing protein n=1 Tax=Clostridium sp. TaxID=1506 RepID=UPI00307BE562
MTDRNGNLNENSRSGSREDGREPVRRNTAMNSREIMLEDEDYLDEPDEGYLDDDYFDRDMEERILREAELDMENIHQPERQDQNRWEEPERLPEKEPEETVSRKRSRARGNQSAGTGREAAHAAPQRGQDSGKTASWTETTPEKAALKAEYRKNGKKAAWIAACTAGILLVAAGGVYVGMSQKYKARFFPNTQINGVDASGKTAAEVQELISEGVNGYTLTIDERNNQTETIAGTDIKLHAEFDGSLEKMVAAQNPFAWLWHMKQEEYTIETMVAYDDAALESQIRNLSCLDPEKAVEPVNAKISEYVSGQGYSIEPEQEGTAVEAEKLTQAVTGAIENLQDHLSLEEADVYKKPTVLKDDESLAEQLDKMNKYAKMSVTYQFGDSTETLNGDQIHAWLIANADGSVSVDSSKVSEYVSEMAKAHNTSNKAKTLKTSYGSTIQVSGGTYGWKINQAAETEALAAIIASGESTTREPEYSQKAASHGANDYGDTYVEINLTGQHLFFYKEGKLVVESDFVSGNLAKG